MSGEFFSSFFRVSFSTPFSLHSPSPSLSLSLPPSPLLLTHLALAQESPRGLGPLVGPDHVHQRPGACSQRLLAQCARQQLPSLDQHLRVRGAHVCGLAVAVPRRRPPAVDSRRQERADKLLARPARPRLEQRRHRHAAVPVLEPHHHVERDVLLDERVARGHEAASEEGVLCFLVWFWLVVERKGKGKKR